MKITITISEEFGSRDEVQLFANGLRDLCTEIFRAKRESDLPRERATPPLQSVIRPIADEPQQNSAGHPKGKTVRRRRPPMPKINAERVKTYFDLLALLTGAFQADPDGMPKRVIDALFRRRVTRVSELQPTQYIEFLTEVMG